MRPPFAYFGGKVGLARKIVDLLPPHRVYLEPFFGSGAVLFAKPPSVHEIANDRDRAVVAFFRCLRERPAELERVCALTPYARVEYEAADLDEDGIDDLEVARRFWVRVNQSFGKSTGRKTGWSLTTARTVSAVGSTLSRLGRFRACAERLASVQFECRPAVEVIERLGAAPEAVIYADPPYLDAARPSVHGGSADYRVGMGDEAAHRELAEVLHSTPATVLLSGYPSDLYVDLYGDWHHVDFAATAFSSNAAGAATRTARVERVWSNRPLPESTPQLWVEEVAS